MIESRPPLAAPSGGFELRGLIPKHAITKNASITIGHDAYSSQVVPCNRVGGGKIQTDVANTQEVRSCNKVRNSKTRWVVLARVYGTFLTETVGATNYRLTERRLPYTSVAPSAKLKSKLKVAEPTKPLITRHADRFTEHPLSPSRGPY